MNNVRILVAEDNDDAREVLEMALRSHGAMVLSASDGEAAIRLLQDSPVDVVVTDISMPLASGFDVLRAVRALPRWLPCIAVSAFSREAIGAGFDEVLAKPFDFPALVRAIAELHGKRG